MFAGFCSTCTHTTLSVFASKMKAMQWRNILTGGPWTNYGGKRSTMSYTNDLHEALLTKDGPAFWKCWRSKFETRASPAQVGGCVDPTAIANNFASYFSEVYAPNNRHCAFLSLRENYFGLPLAADLACI